MPKRRRIAFTTLPTAQSSSFRPSGTEGGDQPQSSRPAEATVRISVPLFQSDDQRYPEFYYPDLVESCQQGREVDPSGDKKDLPDPFNIKEKERQEVEDLGGKRCRKDWFQNLIDMGYRYDESDSFINNSEAVRLGALGEWLKYNEFLPASLDTKYGRFYINMGILEFQQVSESEDDYVKEKCPQKWMWEDGGEQMKKKGESCNKFYGIKCQEGEETAH